MPHIKRANKAVLGKCLISHDHMSEKISEGLVI